MLSQSQPTSGRRKRLNKEDKAFAAKYQKQRGFLCSYTQCCKILTYGTVISLPFLALVFIFTLFLSHDTSHENNPNLNNANPIINTDTDINNDVERMRSEQTKNKNTVHVYRARPQSRFTKLDQNQRRGRKRQTSQTQTQPKQTQSPKPSSTTTTITTKTPKKITLPQIQNAAAVDLDFDPFAVEYRLYENIHCDESDANAFLIIDREFWMAEAEADEEEEGDAAENGVQCKACFSYCDYVYPNGKDLNFQNVRSIQMVVPPNSNQKKTESERAQLDLYSDCAFHDYHASIFAFDECVHIYEWPATMAIKISFAQHLSSVQQRPPRIRGQAMPPAQTFASSKKSRPSVNVGVGDAIAVADAGPSYHVIHSAESSQYLGYQAQANYYAYLSSGQIETTHAAHASSNWTRLLSCQSRDDLSEYIPTFVAPRHPYSRRYGPFNKADVILKWMNSPLNAPTEEIMVVIDPDNWLINDLSYWVKQASEGHPIAERAWFSGNPQVVQLWHDVCLENCDASLDFAAVPYIIHRRDLKRMALLFRKYIIIMKEREEMDKSFLKEYKSIQLGWGTEMFGYIFAAAHIGLRHTIVSGIQVRDVDARPRNAGSSHLAMIHTGRAWFPKNYEAGQQYWHTEGKQFSGFGQQVWCKCNYTASDIIPWPLPADADFQSFHTLSILHSARQYFGDIPKNTQYRQLGKKGYYAPVF